MNIVMVNTWMAMKDCRFYAIDSLSFEVSASFNAKFCSCVVVNADKLKLKL